MKRSRRTLSAFVVLVSLLFSQWALASHACALPQGGQHHTTAATAHAHAMEVAADHHCTEDVTQRSTLCMKHCENVQAANATESPAAHLSAVPVTIALWAMTLLPVTSAPSDGWTAVTAFRQTSPPPLQLSRRLRI
ncbi:MAG: hypothetical protein GC151_14780 [Betaproteobacteria bacterium]|nr:hypothetical protein [Betaproteobacteria bacterium]